MEREREVDHAIVTATAKAIEAEDQVLDVLAAEDVPPEPMVSKVVHRAEDIHVLADQAADEGLDDSVKTDMNARGDGGQVYGG